jgi:hypothetical protein
MARADKEQGWYIRNLLLTPIVPFTVSLTSFLFALNQTFDLKPVGSAKPTSMRTPDRASSGNLRVAAIIEKANAIRQVCTLYS